MSQLTHVDASGAARMVDVTAKPVVFREAVAEGAIVLAPSTVDLIQANQVAKGDVFATARIAGIQAAKRAGELIPLCHPLPITHCEIRLEIPTSKDRVRITATTRIAAQTGVEMEALTAVAVAALTIYDMCKAVDKTMVVGGIRLVSKTKGVAGGGVEAGGKPCWSARRNSARRSSWWSGSTFASAVATRALTSSIVDSSPLQYFSCRTSMLMRCGSRAAAGGAKSMRFMRTPRVRDAHAARRCQDTRLKGVDWQARMRDGGRKRQAIGHGMAGLLPAGRDGLCRRVACTGTAAGQRSRFKG